MRQTIVTGNRARHGSIAPNALPRLLCLLVLALGSTQSRGAADPVARAAAVDAVFDEYARPGSPGVAVGIYRDGKPLLERGYGLANLEFGAPITPTTVFNLASVSKQFTAFCIALLVREGKVDLAADVHTYLPWLPPYRHRLTVEHLVHHVSGMRDYVSLADLVGFDDSTLVRQAQAMSLLARQRDLNFSPGTQYAYSNAGYALLAEIVQAASGKSLRQFAAERIFAPLGMRQTSVRDRLSDLVPQLATGYEHGSEGDGWARAVYNRETIGPGNVLSSVRDLALWADNFLSPKVGDRALIEQLTAPGHMADGAAINYGFGVYRQTFAGHEAITHTGDVPGFSSIVAVFPAERLSVILLSNVAMQQAEVTGKLAASCHGAKPKSAEPPVVRASPGELAELEGDYANQYGHVFALRAREGTLHLTDASGGGEETLTGWTDGSWGERYDRSRMKPVRERGKVTGFVSTGGGVDGWGAPPWKYVKVSRWAPTSAQLDALAGDYYSEDLDATYTLFVESGRLGVRTLWFTEPQRLVPTFADHFDGVSEGAHSDLTISATRRADGSIAGITLHYPDAEQLPLSKVSRVADSR